MTYVLVMCIGVSSWGCGAWPRHEFPSEAACHAALRTMVVQQNGTLATGQASRQTIAYCAPKEISR